MAHSPRVRRLLARLLRPWSAALAAIDPRAFYIGLALALGAWVVATQAFERDRHRASSTYDWMLAHRFRVPVPDPDIVLLDIDERSLAAMSADYGRWPWPRDTLATVLEGLEAQGAKVVVFDILVADPDHQNPVSERAFADAVAKSRIAYFPVLRLDRANDAASKIISSNLEGLVQRRAVSTRPVPTVAVALPYLDAIVRSGRLGTFNVDPTRTARSAATASGRTSATSASCRCRPASRSTSAGRCPTAPRRRCASTAA